jgi:hypothetical protein
MFIVSDNKLLDAALHGDQQEYDSAILKKIQPHFDHPFISAFDHIHESRRIVTSRHVVVSFARRRLRRSPGFPVVRQTSFLYTNVWHRFNYSSFFCQPCPPLQTPAMALRFDLHGSSVRPATGLANFSWHIFAPRQVAMLRSVTM